MSATSPVRGNTTGSSGPSKLHPRTGRNTAIAMAFLVSGFAGFFFSMKVRDDKRRQSGNMPQYEHTISKRPGEYHLHESDSSITRAVKLPVYTHEAQHHARTPGWSTSPDGVSHSHHIHQPAPQRGKGDGSGHVYTKKV
ncbi:hypothetical protein LENED_011164 [Lentinula edodes]|uniref:Uncharacterized protein n=1 Tax=Lentinula edodes TaxID=5353 RepID=A0A1Q3EPB0_LENED|nr:uncharacterized protein C8R40DRAFT_1074822 [Lentinula edodes]KAH7868467.1 hypothetical protein C8R40DRAFT_1074822 [Lentinula edodes]KAJ3915706.1 hypothetical protein F5877DRAFT_69652 [Lentinula edodes]GAW09037.1 hypothetical protein LENED_011164 [Lentinula edodes]